MDTGPKNFEEFADMMMRDLHDGLLKGGSNEMRRKLYTWLPSYVVWLREKQAEK